MSLPELHKLPRSLGPWGADSTGFNEQVLNLLRSQAVLFGLVNLRQPGPETFLAASGLDPQNVRDWCQSGHRDDELLKQARKKGSASGASEPTPLGGGRQAMVLVLPIAGHPGQSWYLAVAREKEPYTDQEQQSASLLLRMLESEFDAPAESDCGRVLLEHDFAFAHADPRTHATMLSNPQALEQLTEQLGPILQQRWPELDGEQRHDLALDPGGIRMWIRLKPLRPLGEDAAHPWYLELRPLDADDVPPIGQLEDDRVARAIGYLNDNYQQSPTLNELARVVQTSPFHFHRLFMRHAGISPKHYLLRTQLMIAKWLLRATRMPIGRIASETGFASHGHFTATFHRIVKLSPSAFREQS